MARNSIKEEGDSVHVITAHNDCIYICAKRKPLVEKAKEIQSQWIQELEKDLEIIKSIDI